jgi:hypothetical protein
LKCATAEASSAVGFSNRAAMSCDGDVATAVGEAMLATRGEEEVGEGENNAVVVLNGLSVGCGVAYPPALDCAVPPAGGGPSERNNACFPNAAG